MTTHITSLTWKNKHFSAHYSVCIYDKFRCTLLPMQSNTYIYSTASGIVTKHMQRYCIFASLDLENKPRECDGIIHGSIACAVTSVHCVESSRINIVISSIDWPLHDSVKPWHARCAWVTMSVYYALRSNTGENLSVLVVVWRLITAVVVKHFQVINGSKLISTLCMLQFQYTAPFKTLLFHAKKYLQAYSCSI